MNFDSISIFFQKIFLFQFCLRHFFTFNLKAAFRNIFDERNENLNRGLALSAFEHSGPGLPNMFALSPEYVRLLSFRKLYTVFRSFGWRTTVEPVLIGTVLSGHPLLVSGQLSKSRILCPLIIVILTSIKRSRSLFTNSQRAVSIVPTCLKRSLCK